MDELTPDWTKCLVASSPANVRTAVVLHVSSWWRTAKGKARGVVHLWRGRLAAVAVAAGSTDGVL